jgi:hypothetical protein
MKYVRKIFKYLYGRPMDRYEEDYYEIILGEILSILIVSAIVVCSVYLLITIK